MAYGLITQGNPLRDDETSGDYRDLDTHHIAQLSH